MRRFWRRRATHLLSNSFELWIGAAAALAGLAFFVDPEALRVSSVGRAGGVLAYSWNAVYCVSGLLIVTSLLVPRGAVAPGWTVRAEVLGLLMLAGGASVHAIATVAIRGPSSSAVVATYLGVAAAAVSRAYYLRRLAMIAWSPDSGRG